MNGFLFEHLISRKGPFRDMEDLLGPWTFQDLFESLGHKLNPLGPFWIFQVLLGPIMTFKDFFNLSRTS